MTDRDHVHEQYRTEVHLEVRQSVWHPTREGRDPATEALAAVVAAAPRRVLEIGCGTGAFAGRLANALPDAEVVAVDQSARLVELTASRGVEARVADALDLPFADDAFDAVAAMWMLYHLPDLHRGLAEARRVLRPDGILVAVTNGDDHLGDLRREAGGAPLHTQFSSENGEAALREHFDVVTRDDLSTRAFFADHNAAVAYLASWPDDVTWSLPPFEGPREYAGHVTVFVAR
ncbi:class I SAM-dependent methyltransferase [Nocardioides dongxiaopingii]|uniref:class I SAM-dependent methyltransferase n=1 Tax=Nocardioides sp. S-1144 TaxID=2582905 RepID=UPI0021CB4823|nr:class I SAM-dependent methyltransferase [Nocardioides sp. S-1144]